MKESFNAVGQKIGLKTRDVIAAYKRNGKNRSATARALGCSIATIAYHLKKAALKK